MERAVSFRIEEEKTPRAPFTYLLLFVSSFSHIHQGLEHCTEEAVPGEGNYQYVCAAERKREIVKRFGLAVHAHISCALHIRPLLNVVYE